MRSAMARVRDGNAAEAETETLATETASAKSGDQNHAKTQRRSWTSPAPRATLAAAGDDDDEVAAVVDSVGDA